MVKKAKRMTGMITLQIGNGREIIIKRYINPSGSCLMDALSIVELEQKEKADKGQKEDMEW